MIYCPLCGTANKPNSKFCKNCGAALAESKQVRCPICWTMNAEDASHCENCGAQLKGASAPTKSIDSAETIAPFKPPDIPPPPEQEEEDTPADDSPRDQSSDVSSLAQSGGAAANETQAATIVSVSSAEQAHDALSAEDTAMPTAAAAMASASEQPSQLQSEGQTERATEAAEPPTQEYPDWLKTVLATTAAAAVAEERDQAEQEPAPMAKAKHVQEQAQLQTALPENTGASTASDLPNTSAHPESAHGESEAQPSALPDWVKELAPPDETADDADATGRHIPAAVIGLELLEEPPEMDEAERAALPDWLREPESRVSGAVVAGVVAAHKEPAVEGTTAGTSETELEAETRATAPVVGELAVDEEVPEPTGPLAGLRGILPLAAAIAEPHVIPLPDTSGAASDGTSSGRVFKAVMAEQAVSQAVTKPSDKTAPLFSINHLLYLVIFVLALVPLFMPLELSGLGLEAAKSTTAVFYDQVQALVSGSTALVAFDYSPGQAVELEPAARAVVSDLARRGVNVVAVSLTPAGAALAQTILEHAALENPRWVFFNVGFIAGGEAGLRALANSWLPSTRTSADGILWRESPLSASVQSMNDAALIVLVAGDEANLRAWMEQVQPRVTPRIVAATTAAIEPQARNYVDSAQLAGALSGLTGAAEFELLTNTAGRAVRTVDALSLLSVALAAIIVAGNVAFLVGRK